VQKVVQILVLKLTVI